jgi:hypothetical protein
VGLWSKILGGSGDAARPDTERPSKVDAERASKLNGLLAQPPASAEEPKRHSTIVPKSTPAAAALDPARARSALVVSPTSLTAAELMAPTGRPPLPTLSGLGLDGDGSEGGAALELEGSSSVPVLFAQGRPLTSGIEAPMTLLLERPASLPERPAASGRPEVPAEKLSSALELLVEFSFRLSLGPVSEAWLAAGAQSAYTLQVAARGGWQPHLLASFEGLELLLAEGARKRVLPILWRLSDSVPDWPAAARNLRETARRRERRVVSEILASVDGLKSGARSRFAQEKSLTHLVAAAAEILAEELETPLERARELAQVVLSYDGERHASPVDLGHREALRRATQELEQRHAEFEACDDDLRAARQKRRQALTRVNLVLAERGDLPLLVELEPLSIAERLGRLRTLLGPDLDGLESD